jgi:SNF2 family DNA or RNA helicase
MPSRTTIEQSKCHLILFDGEITTDDRTLNTHYNIPQIQESALNLISGDTLYRIKEIDTLGQYGSKIQTLIQHLLWLKATEPGSKAIVFSAWADSLTILDHAFMQNGISSVRIDIKKAGESSVRRFYHEPELQVLLLHGYALVSCPQYLLRLTALTAERERTSV